MVAAAKQIGPVAGFRDFEQSVVIAVERAEPVHHALESRAVLSEKVEIASLPNIGVQSDDRPQPAVDGADAADAAVIRRAIINAHVGGYLAVGSNVAENGSQ